MPLRYYANAPATTLAAGCTAVSTTIEVASVAGLPIQYPYTLILDREQTTEEAVSVTGASGTTLTVSRAIDGTTAFAHSLGADVVHGITAQDVREPNVHINAATGVHGVVGSVVGTSDTQTLTNKDLTAATNLFPSSLALANDLTAHTGDTGQHVPVGAISAFIGASAPAGGKWLLCQGQAISRTTYSALFAIISTTYGAGDGSTTFNLPDLRGRLPLGANASHARGAAEGSETKTLITAHLPAHSHSMAHTHTIHHDHPSTATTSAGAHTHDNFNSTQDGSFQNFFRTGDANNGNGTASGNIQSAGAHTHDVDIPFFSGTSGAASAGQTGDTGSGSALDIMPPTLAVNFIIRVL